MTLNGRNSRQKIKRNLERSFGHFTEMVIILDVRGDSLGNQYVREGVVEFEDSRGDPYWTKNYENSFSAQLRMNKEDVPDDIQTVQERRNADAVYIPRLDEYFEIIEKHISNNYVELNIEPLGRDPSYAPIQFDKDD